MYRKSAQGWFKHLDFIILDVICLHIAFVIAYAIRHGVSNPYAIPIYRNIAFVMTGIDILVIVFFETLKNVLKRGYYKEFSMTVKHTCLVELLIIFYLFSIQSGEQYSRTTLIMLGVIYALLTYPVRVLWKLYLEKKRGAGGKRSLIIITSDALVDRVIRNIKNHNYEGFNLTGIAVIDRDLKGKVIG